MLYMSSPIGVMHAPMRLLICPRVKITAKCVCSAANVDKEVYDQEDQSFDRNPQELMMPNGDPCMAAKAGSMVR